jgi:hypothetical protein
MQERVHSVDFAQYTHYHHHHRDTRRHRASCSGGVCATVSARVVHSLVACATMPSLSTCVFCCNLLQTAGAIVISLITCTVVYCEAISYRLRCNGGQLKQSHTKRWHRRRVCDGGGERAERIATVQVRERHFASRWHNNSVSVCLCACGGVGGLAYKGERECQHQHATPSCVRAMTRAASGGGSGGGIIYWQWWWAVVVYDGWLGV